MTLRRYYAGQAMVGLLASSGIANAVDAEAYAAESEGAGNLEGAMGRMARLAWRIADVMLLEE